MRHDNQNKKFGRERDVRRALMKSLINALIRDEKIKTTETKAKALRPSIERLVTRAKKDDVASLRLLIARTGSKRSAHKLVKDIAPKYKSQKGGYTRIIKTTPRKSDGSKMAIIEFV